ncbi:hypothetical protein BH24ACT5_BH24ACT5_10840 [soil metagenome]
MAEAVNVDIPAARRRLADMMAGVGPHNLIGGQWRPPTGFDTEEQFDPSSGDTIGRLTYSSDDDLAAAVRSAAATQPAWASTTVPERIALLERLGDAITAARPLLVPLIALEVGKTLAEADNEIELSYQLLQALGDIERREESSRCPLGGPDA